MRPPVDDSAIDTVSPLSFRRAPTELAMVWRSVGMFCDFERTDEYKVCDGVVSFEPDQIEKSRCFPKVLY